MTFQDSVKTVLMQKYAAFTGRASRSEYWWFVLAYIIGMILLGWIPVVNWIYWLATIVPFAAVGYRRMQDIGKPGWYFFIPAAYNLLVQIFGLRISTEIGPDGMPVEMPSAGAIMLSGVLGLVGLVLAIVFLWWLTRPSDPQTNEYGPPPADVVQG